MISEQIHRAAGALNTSTFFAGIMMLLLNVGSRYIVHEFSDDDAEYRQNILIRRICIFAVCFVGTKDILTSLILTAGFIIMSSGLFRGKGEASREGMATLSQIGAISTFGQMQDPAPPLFGGDE